MCFQKWSNFEKLRSGCRRRLQPVRAPKGASLQVIVKPTKPDCRPAAPAKAGAYIVPRRPAAERNNSQPIADIKSSEYFTYIHLASGSTVAFLTAGVMQKFRLLISGSQSTL